MLLIKLRNLAFRIVQVANHPRPTYATFYARWEQTCLQTVRAEGAFVGGFGLFIDKTGIVRTRLHAVATADTLLVVDHHDAVFALEGRLHRTDRHARRLVAVVAQARQHHIVRHLLTVGDFILTHRGAEAVQRRGVLHRTAHRTSLTADTFA